MLARWLLRVGVFTSCLLYASLTLVAQEKGQIGIFGGGSWFYGSNFVSSYPVPNTVYPYKFIPGGFFGIRVREMLTEHFGLEQSVTVLGNNNARFGTDIQVPERISFISMPTGMAMKGTQEFALTLALVRGLICFVRPMMPDHLFQIRSELIW